MYSAEAQISLVEPHHKYRPVQAYNENIFNFCRSTKYLITLNSAKRHTTLRYHNSIFRIELYVGNREEPFHSPQQISVDFWPFSSEINSVAVVHVKISLTIHYSSNVAQSRWLLNSPQSEREEGGERERERERFTLYYGTVFISYGLCVCGKHVTAHLFSRSLRLLFSGKLIHQLRFSYRSFYT